jgi:hypothetical protein
LSRPTFADDFVEQSMELREIRCGGSGPAAILAASVVREFLVPIRQFQPGDEVVQAALFNGPASALPGYKPATADDLRRRTLSPSFAPDLWLYANEGGSVVGYCMAQANGRVGYPWCKAGFERIAEPLFEAILAALRNRKVRRVYAAYVSSWTEQAAYFLAHGFAQKREMVNFIQELTNLPTLLFQSHAAVSALEPSDVPAILAMAPQLWPGFSAESLRRDWFENPMLPPESLFVVRSRMDQHPIAAGRLVENDKYADPAKVDAAQPCFRLGAFGAEGFAHKRINGLFSVVMPADSNATSGALDLLAHAAAKFDGGGTHSLAAQAPSDVPHLIAFYDSHFVRQGSFPVFERSLSD